MAEKLRPFGTTIFSEMTKLAIENEAINLSQGFPDFEGPTSIVDAAVEALRSGHNQYARSMGVGPLVEAIATERQRLYGLQYDPMSEVTVFSGATEGLMSTALGLLDPGDEVVLFEPVYDSYPACLAMAGAKPKYATLRFPDFALDLDELSRLITPSTKMLVLNSPHNPTGKVFSREELEAIAKLCIENDVIAMTDEVYEHLTYDGTAHVPLASIDGMRDRTISIGSTGKTYSLTGWKIGWATGPTHLIKGAQAAHQFVTFATATPLQHAVAHAIEKVGPTYFDTLRAEYTERRDHLLETLRSAGLEPAVPKGAYFVLADFTKVFDGDDVAYVKSLVNEKGVAAIPPSFFYPSRPEEGRRLARFAFCKRMETLRAARGRITGNA